MRSPRKGPAYRGFDQHINVSVTKKQLAKLNRQARGRVLSRSALVRSMIDELVEVEK